MTHQSNNLIYYVIASFILMIGLAIPASAQKISFTDKGDILVEENIPMPHHSEHEKVEKALWKGLSKACKAIPAKVSGEYYMFDHVYEVNYSKETGYEVRLIADEDKDMDVEVLKTTQVAAVRVAIQARVFKAFTGKESI